MENFVIKEGVHFIGKPCKSCGNCIRYTKGEQRCIACAKKYHKQHYLNNRNERIEQRMKYFEENRELELERMRQNYHENKEERAEQSKQYRKENPEKMRIQSIRRRARKNNAEGSFTAQEWLDLCNKYGNKCLVPGCENINLTVDHVIPLIKGGSDWITNIQPLCHSCNSSKGTKTIDYRETFNIQGETII